MKRQIIAASVAYSRSRCNLLKRSSAILATMVLCFAAFGASARVGGLFEPLDVFELEVAANPQISPDGARVVYERRAFDIMTDSTRTSLWIIDSDGSNHRPLVADGGSYSSPVFSPDGGRLAYFGTVNETTQIVVRWLDTGESAVLTNLQYAPADLTWSPDGSALAFTMELPADTEPLAAAPKKPEGAEWAPAVKVIESVTYRFDGRGFLEPAHSQVFVVPALGGSPAQLTEGPYHHRGPLSWTPDSSAIVFGANREEDWEYDRLASDLWRVTVADGTLEALTDSGEAQAPVVSPDGSRVAFLSARNVPEPYRNRFLKVLDLEDGTVSTVTADLDRSIETAYWARNGRGLYIVYADQALKLLAYQPLQGERQDLTDAIGGVSLGRPYVSGSASVAGNGTAAFTVSRPDRPAELAVVDRRGSVDVLTDLNGDLLGRRQLGKLEEVVYPSSLDGTQIQGWYLLPPDYEPGKRYPTILEIHGGPHSAYGPSFSAEMQLMAAAGYVVFYNNYRGSTSYGTDFALLLKYKYSSADDFADHDTGLNLLVEQGIADPEQLYITGGSAGGIATLYAIGLTDRFRAAAAAKPIANWISKTLTGDIYTTQISNQFPGPPWEEFEHYWQRSPLSLVGKVTTPTLLLTGEEDYRTPISETEQYYQALKLLRVDTAMVRIPESSHGIASRPSRLIAKVANILAWFERYGPQPEPADLPVALDSLE